MPRDRITGKKRGKKCVGVSLSPDNFSYQEEREPTKEEVASYEMKQLFKSAAMMETVGFSFPTVKGEVDMGRLAFKLRAHLWRAIKHSIAEVYFRSIMDGILFIEDSVGNKYGLVLILENKTGVYPPLPEDVDDDLCR